MDPSVTSMNDTATFPLTHPISDFLFLLLTLQEVPHHCLCHAHLAGLVHLFLWATVRIHLHMLCKKCTTHSLLARIWNYREYMARMLLVLWWKRRFNTSVETRKRSPHSQLGKKIRLLPAKKKRPVKKKQQSKILAHVRNEMNAMRPTQATESLGW